MGLINLMDGHYGRGGCPTRSDMSEEVSVNLSAPHAISIVGHRTWPLSRRTHSITPEARRSTSTSFPPWRSLTPSLGCRAAIPGRVSGEDWNPKPQEHGTSLGTWSLPFLGTGALRSRYTALILRRRPKANSTLFLGSHSPAPRPRVHQVGGGPVVPLQLGALAGRLSRVLGPWGSIGGGFLVSLSGSSLLGENKAAEW